MRLRLIIIALLAVVVFVRGDEKPAVLDSSGIVWRPDNTVSASIENLPLDQVLEALSDLRKWQVLVEPDLKSSVTTRFKNLPQSDALRRLLNDVNFVIIPSRKGPSRMLVYETSSKNAVRRIVPTKRLAKRDKPEKKDDGKIDNELIVTIDPKSGIDIGALARQLGAKIKGKIDGLDIYQLEFEDAEAADKALAQLEQNDGVASVDSNFTIQQPEQLSPVNLPAPPLNLRPSSADKDGIVVGLIGFQRPTQRITGWRIFAAGIIPRRHLGQSTRTGQPRHLHGGDHSSRALGFARGHTGNLSQDSAGRCLRPIRQHIHF